MVISGATAQFNFRNMSAYLLLSLCHVLLIKFGDCSRHAKHKTRILTTT